MGKFRDLTGQKFNRLLVIKQGEHKNGRVSWICRCDCGTIKNIISKSLVDGNTKSCGCYNLEKAQLPKYRINNEYDLTGEYGIGYIRNTGGKFTFDLEDYDKIKHITWTQDPKGYLVGVYYKKRYKLHRLIMGVKGNEDIVDHKDGDCTRNTKDNLRIVKSLENAQNAKMRSDNSSGAKGVRRNKNRWCAEIQSNKIRYILGSFINKEDAIRTREIAELKLFGEYSRGYEELKEKYKNVDLTKHKPFIEVDNKNNESNE